MKVLGLDTSTETGGVALVDEGRLVAEYTLSLQRTTHSERLLPALRRVLDDAGWHQHVEGIAVALGPGSFTGLRIGVVTAKMLAYTWRVPVVGVSTLDALAYQATGGAPIVCAIMDARHGNVYSAVYDTTGPLPVPLLSPGLRAADDLFAALDDELAAVGFPDERVLFTGDALAVYWDGIKARLGPRGGRVAPGYAQLRCGAVAMLGAARFARGDEDDPMQLVPMYLRKSEA